MGIHHERIHHESVIPSFPHEFLWREGLWQILDYQRPIGAALQSLREEVASGGPLKWHVE